jgi:GTP1/Obg family GTP-binding protein
MEWKSKTEPLKKNTKPMMEELRNVLANHQQPQTKGIADDIAHKLLLETGDVDVKHYQDALSTLDRAKEIVKKIAGERINYLQVIHNEARQKAEETEKDIKGLEQLISSDQKTTRQD